MGDTTSIYGWMFLLSEIRSQVESVFTYVKLVIFILPSLNMHSTYSLKQLSTPQKGIEIPITSLQLCLKHLNTSSQCFVWSYRFLSTCDNIVREQRTVSCTYGDGTRTLHIYCPVYSPLHYNITTNILNQKHVTLKCLTATLFLGTKLGILGYQFCAQIWTKIRAKLHARENARVTWHPIKEIFKLKNIQLWARVKRFKIMSCELFSLFTFLYKVNVFIFGYILLANQTKDR